MLSMCFSCYFVFVYRSFILISKFRFIMRQFSFSLACCACQRVIIITIFQEDNIFGTDARLTFGPQLTNVDMLLKK